MEIKICSKCNIEKPVNEFYFIEKRQEYNKTCRVCERTIRKERENSDWYKKRRNLEKENEELIKNDKRRCSECLEIKNVTDFYFRKEQQKYRLECKKCLIKKQSEKKEPIRKAKREKKEKEKKQKVIPTSKVCTKCNIEKTISAFRKNKRGYILTVCQECEYKLNIERYYKNKMQNESYKKRYEAKLDEELLLKENKKRCLKCFEVKDLTEFYYRKDLKKYRNWCIACEKNRIDEFYQDVNNQEKRRKRRLEYYEENHEILLQRKKEYAINHKEELRAYHTKYVNNRRKTDEIFKFKSQVRHLINMSFRRQGLQKRGKTEEIVGCDFKTLQKHLLKTYKDNYGVEWDGIEDVHIDHIIPLSTVSTIEEIIELCYYTNLQLLKAKDNLDKKDKLNWSLKD